VAQPEQYEYLGEDKVPEAERFDPVTKTWGPAPAQRQYALRWGPTKVRKEVWHVDPIDGFIFPESKGAKVKGVWYSQRNAVEQALKAQGF
jgi:hypothetical protein